jgi:hypothetical protein
MEANKPMEGELIPSQVGRKPKFDKDAHCQMLLNIASEGKPLSSFLVYVGISKTTYYNWIEKHDSFKEAVDLAEEYRKAFYHEKLMQAAFSNLKCNPLLVSKLFDHYNTAPREFKEGKGPNIVVNIDNTGKQKELTAEQRQERLEELKQQWIEDKDDTRGNNPSNSRDTG